MTEQRSTADLAETARVLRALIAQIDAGEIEADEAERAYLSASADMLDRLAD